MPGAYVIVEMKVSDPERYKEYMAESPATIVAGGGEFLARGGRCETLEGEWLPIRLVVVRFPTFDQAKAWYYGEQYRQARAKRAGATEFFNMVLVEGVPST
jgi:uncharacterized protein (DUF1330 family)